jgi:hypothetical protein
MHDDFKTLLILENIIFVLNLETMGGDKRRIIFF